MFGGACVVAVLAWWCTGSIMAWGGIQGGMKFILPLSLVLGGISAVILGISLTISAHVMLSAKHKVTIKVPKEIQALHSILNVSYN